jgi:hypothetical protein
MIKGLQKDCPISGLIPALNRTNFLIRLSFLIMRDYMIVHLGKRWQCAAGLAELTEIP